jgi:YkoY family integral membrane protein
MGASELLQLFITLLLIVTVEGVLSFDNAAVLALIVNKRLPAHQRNRALKYGIIGAFAFRGLSLFFVSWIINNPSFGAGFKVVGGLYLLWLGYKGLTPEADSVEEGNVGWVEKMFSRLGLGVFWSTVVIVEFVDLIFSIDNLVAVVGMSDSIAVIIVGVSLGIITMRFAATWFVKMIGKYPSLETSAFIVILLLGIKLTLTGVVDFTSAEGFKRILESHAFDLIFSAIMMLIFFIPILFKRNRYAKAV